MSVLFFSLLPPTAARKPPQRTPTVNEIIIKSSPHPSGANHYGYNYKKKQHQIMDRPPKMLKISCLLIITVKRSEVSTKKIVRNPLGPRFFEILISVTTFIVSIGTVFIYRKKKIVFLYVTHIYLTYRSFNAESIVCIYLLIFWITACIKDHQ